MKIIFARSKSRISCLSKGLIACSTFCLLLLSLTCCSNEKDKKIEELTKKVDELSKVKIDQNNLVVMQLQENCGKESDKFITKEYGNIEMFTRRNHYNKRLNKCFVLVSFYNNNISNIGGLQETLYDPFENRKYGNLFIDHADGSKITCNLLDTHCKSYDEWNSLIKPYMEE
jgi:hypothetical protein